MIGRALGGVTAVMTVALFSRGLDYLIFNQHRPVHMADPGLGVTPLWWGVACLATSLLICFGACFHEPRVVAYGAGVAGVINLLISGPMLFDAFNPILDHWRFGVDHLTRGVIWGVIAYTLVKRDVIFRAAEKRSSYGSSAADS